MERMNGQMSSAWSEHTVEGKESRGAQLPSISHVPLMSLFCLPERHQVLTSELPCSLDSDSLGCRAQPPRVPRLPLSGEESPSGTHFPRPSFARDWLGCEKRICGLESLMVTLTCTFSGGILTSSSGKAWSFQVLSCPTLAD